MNLYLALMALLICASAKRFGVSSSLSSLSSSLSSLLQNNSYRPVKKYSIKVVTDIDDTIVSSGGLNIFGINLGGVDNQFKRGTFYPGVVQFNLELSSAMGLPSKMAVLTARAKEFKFALEVRPSGKLCAAFRDRGLAAGVDWGIGEVYYGSVNEWVFQAQKGLRKFLNFEIMLTRDAGLGLEVQYVIVGDTGEKDEEAAERIISKYPSKVKAVFLHSVYRSRYRRDSIFPDVPGDRQINGVNVFYFRTYVGAAVKAYSAGLLDAKALKRVTAQAVNELEQSSALLAGGSLQTRLLQRLTQDRLQRQADSSWAELASDAAQVPFLMPLLPSSRRVTRVRQLAGKVSADVSL
mmetsp:Transcript_16988/g.37783  ORF Transcript_16988/g.37783 Transcript_16988/m.37783 type:complete len:351 (-) Transcript_16988:244-1296(-)